jgi:pyrophosphatase PpaX
MPRLSTILLDLDGTLVDTVDFILASVHHAFDGHPRRPTDAEWLAGIGKPLRVQLREIVGDEAEVERLVARYRSHQREHHDARTRAFGRAAEAVVALRAAGCAIGIVTSKLVEPAERTLRHVGLAPHVDVLVGADSCERHKPDPAPVLLALERLGRRPAEALFAGDSHHDIAAGRAAGVVTVGALWGASSSTARSALLAARPDHLLAGIEELPGLVARLARDAA